MPKNHGGHRTPSPGKRSGRPPEIEDPQELRLWVSGETKKRLLTLFGKGKVSEGTRAIIERGLDWLIANN